MRLLGWKIAFLLVGLVLLIRSIPFAWDELEPIEDPNETS